MQRLMCLGIILSFVFALTGCNTMAEDTAQLVKIVVVVSLLLALGGALVVMFTNRTEQRYAAGLVTLGAGLLGALFLILLVA